MTAKPEGDPKEIGARLAREGKKEADAAGYGWHRPADLYALHLGAFEELLPAYLTEYEISAEEALQALDLLSGRTLYDVEAFKAQDPDGFADLLEVERRYWVAKSVAQSLYTPEEGIGKVDPERPVYGDAPADLVEAVRAEAREVAAQGQGAGFAWLVNGPDCVQEEAAKYENLVAPYEIPKAEAKAKAKAILQGRPDAVSYLKTKGWGRGIGSSSRRPARQVLAALVRRQGGKVAEEKAISSSRLIVPQAFLGLSVPVSRLAKWKRQLRPYNEETQLGLELLEEVQESRSQMAEFSTTELRVIIGAYSSCSRHTDDGRSWPEAVRVPFATFAADCALDLSSGKNRDDLLEALRSVGTKPVNATISFKEGNNRKAILWSGPILKTALIVDASTPQAKAALETWRETGKWFGDAPEEIVLKLQEIHRYLPRPLVLDPTVLHRIDAAAKKVRGRLVDLDLLLFWKLFNIGPRQIKRLGPNGQPLTYINRDQFLEDCQGAERLAKERRAGRYRTRIEGPYFKSVEILVEAGVIFPDWQSDYQARDGRRDVFEVQPWVERGPRQRAAPRPKKALPARRRKT
jgi:hypothetical protein